jgi:autonomous glycyl radical cofactor GrcA
MKITDDKGMELVEIDLGIVDVGKEKEYTFYLNNDSDAELKNIVLKPDYEEVVVVSAPNQIQPNSTEAFIIKWAPTLKLKQGLKTTVNITATELWR